MCIEGFVKKDLFRTGVEAASTVSARTAVFVSGDRLDTHGAGSQEGKTDCACRRGSACWQLGEGGAVAQLVKCLLCSHEDPSSTPRTQ